MASVREGGRQLRCSECARSRGKGEERPWAKGQPRKSQEGRITLSTGWTYACFIAEYDMYSRLFYFQYFG